MSEANMNAVWPHGSTAIAVNPAKRQSVVRGLAWLVVVGVAYCALVLDDTGPMMTWAKQVAKQEEAQKYAPTMRQLADAGKPDAIMWMARNFPDTEAFRLDALVRAGSGEAAWTLASIKWKSDKAEARRLMELAAANGYLPAMQYEQRPFR